MVVFDAPRGLTDESEIIKFLQHGTLVGLLPVPHPILIRKYQVGALCSYLCGDAPFSSHPKHVSFYTGKQWNADVVSNVHVGHNLPQV